MPFPHTFTEEDRKRATEAARLARQRSEKYQVAKLQQKAFEMAESESDKIALDAMNAFIRLGDWKRVLNMKPLPGSLKPETDKPDKRAASSGASARAFTASLVAAAKQAAPAQADVPA